MKLPNLGYIREHPSVAVPNTPRERSGFAMTPWKVLTDPRLSHSAIRIYGILAACRRGAGVSMGTRLIASSGCMSQTTAVEGLKELRESGYAEVAPRKNGARASYRLTYQRFAVEAPDAKAEPSVEKKPRKELVRCPKCSKRVGGLKRVGWCRACDRDLNTRKLVREEIAKLA